MKNISAPVAVSLIAVAVIYFIGHSVFVSGPKNELKNIVLETERLKADNISLEAQLSRLSSAKSEKARSPRCKIYLEQAAKAELMSKIVELQKKTVKMSSFEILPSFYAKSADDADFQDTGETDLSKIQIGPDGMPIGLSSQSEDYKGIEIVPVRFSFTSAYNSLGRFFTQVYSSLPVHSVRMFDLRLKDNEIVKGTVILNFPMAEKGAS